MEIRTRSVGFTAPACPTAALRHRSLLGSPCGASERSCDLQAHSKFFLSGVSNLVICYTLFLSEDTG
jgi:hypothetical protein